MTDILNGKAISAVLYKSRACSSVSHIQPSNMTHNLVLNSTWEAVHGGLDPPNSSRWHENTRNVTYVDFYLHKPSVAAVFTVSYLLIFVVCMAGNGVVCFIVLRSRNMRTVTNLFILNLAISDLLVGIFCMPTTLVDNIITGLAV